MALQITLESGRASRRAYYDRRARDFGEVERRALAHAFTDTPSGGSRTRQEIEADSDAGVHGGAVRGLV